MSCLIRELRDDEKSIGLDPLFLYNVDKLAVLGGSVAADGHCLKRSQSPVILKQAGFRRALAS